MAKSKNSGLSLDHLDIQEIAQFQVDIENSLRAYFDEESNGFEERFALLSKEEVRARLEQCIQEHELDSSLKIMTAIEAALRVDFLQRVNKKLKDEISKEFRSIRKAKKERVSLEEHILKVWKKHEPRSKGLLDGVGNALKYRHWLAHGRYWILNPALQIDYLALYQLAARVIAEIPLQKPDYDIIRRSEP